MNSADVAEEWRAVAGYEGIYEVSNHGRVRSLDRVGGQGRRYTGKLMKQSLLKRPEGRSGNSVYRVVGLTKEGVQTPFRVHCLVLETFVGSRPEGMLGLHRDDNPENNHISNLYWGTYSENTLDALKNGKYVPVRNVKTHCTNGHEYTEENTTWSSKGYRVCKACRSKHGAETYARRTGKAL